ncbi:Xylose isomerase domain protein TIM barrel [Chthoniobacter flavus Ellin428]|uniref:Xylose isomerase domain protein TIM barrel n=1 Tax=Chthoniobacter flavus Ellin428 TaxID=497964 RepID=B4D6E6_9BACT|nr:TIM barrel protein [Chthoniobacter flavus]EDY18055.1 Xylose isomerase domain protein TIM barrel [Chthoniobacter flavus Ellin428]TCO88296.1 hexulose-6-phosphate isomerase [Chthoniobacter flavus]
MNRRTFLQTTGAALAASALTPLAHSVDTPAKKRPIKKAVNLGMVKVSGSVEDKFKAVRDAGFDGIELNLPDADLSVDIINQAKAASGLDVAGIICTPHWKFPLSDPDPAKRERTVIGLQQALTQGGEIGCTRVLLVPGVVNKQVDYLQCWQRAIEGIKRCTDAAEKAKCHIAIENVWNLFITNPVDAARFVDEINHPYVGWHFDIGNCVTYGWPEHWVRILNKRIRNLHIKEYSRKKRDAEGPYKGFQVELGEGDDDWPSIMTALDEIGYQGYGILEVPGGDATRLKFLAERTDKILAS